MGLKILVIPVTAFGQNARVLYLPGSPDATLVDPGGDAEKLQKELSRLNLVCTQIWLTHSHLDHCGAVAQMKKPGSVSLYGHASERWFREHVCDHSLAYGLSADGMENCPEPDRFLSGGEDLQACSLSFRAIHTPGHSPGSICYYCAAEGLVIVGDVLFAGSIGRTDLPGGNSSQLLASIRGLLASLPPETKVLSGHGPDSSLAHEARTNPYLIDQGWSS